MYKLTVAGVLAWFMLSGGHGAGSTVAPASAISQFATPVQSGASQASLEVVGSQAAAVGMDAAKVAYSAFTGLYKAAWQALWPQLSAAMAGVKNDIGGRASGSAYNGTGYSMAYLPAETGKVAQNAPNQAIAPISSGTWYDHAGETQEQNCTEGPTDNLGGFHYCY